MKQLTLLSVAWDGWQAKRAGWLGIWVHRDHINYLDANARSQRNAWTDHEPTDVLEYWPATGLPGDFWRSEQLAMENLDWTVYQAIDVVRPPGPAAHTIASLFICGLG